MLPEPIFGIFHMYGLMIAVGILSCFGVLFQFGKKRKIQTKFIDFVFYNGIAAIVLGFGSAALFQATYNYIENPEAGFNFNSGLTFLGGLIGGVVTFLLGYAIFRKKYSARLVDILPIVPCCILIAHAFGRVGCFCAGCCYGKPTDSFLGVQFPYVDGKVHPTQLYEAAFLFAMFAVCYLLYWKKHFKYNFTLYLITYGIFRFCIEYVRGDHRGELVAGISPSQFWAILMVVLGVAVYFLLKYLYEKRDAEFALEQMETIKRENNEEGVVAEEELIVEAANEVVNENMPNGEGEECEI